MKVIIVGLGKIGTTILDNLVAEKHDVLAIDSDPDVVYNITNTYDVMGMCGDGAQYEQLLEGGADKCDLFIAVTGSDELNMLSCFVAKKMGAKNTVARIRNTEYTGESLDFIKKNLDISMIINPEKLTAEALYNMLKLPSAVKVETFTGRAFEMLELSVKENSPLDGKSLIDIRKKCNEKFLVTIIRRGDEVYIPTGSSVICAGDKIFLIVVHSHAHSLLKHLGLLYKESKDVIIVGASQTAHYLTEMLLKGRSSVKIIEKSADKCEDFAENLTGDVSVIHGDAMSQDLLLEEGIENVDAFVALTGQDEENILMSFYAISKNVPKVVSKVNRKELSLISENLGLDSIISPKNVIADIILRYARALTNAESTVKSLYSLVNGKAEALEFDVMSDFEYSGVLLANLPTKKDVIIAGIVRNGKAIIPGGEDAIMTGDRIIIIAKEEKIYSLSDIIRQ